MMEEVYATLNKTRHTKNQQKKTTAKQDIENDPKYQESKQLLLGVEKIRDDVAKLLGISPEEVEKWMDHQLIRETVVHTEIPHDLKTYQSNRENKIEGLGNKKEKIKAVADKLIEEGKVSYTTHPSGKGHITHFNNVNGITTKFYDATQLVQPEKIKKEEMTNNYTYEYSF
jgi:hypothetical protein